MLNNKQQIMQRSSIIDANLNLYKKLFKILLKIKIQKTKNYHIDQYCQNPT